jgi:hypothetical protein
MEGREEMPEMEPMGETDLAVTLGRSWLNSKVALRFKKFRLTSKSFVSHQKVSFDFKKIPA